MSDVTLCVLAGGEAKRMGRAKAELRIDGVAILKFLLDRMNWRGPTMLVTAPMRQHPPGCELFDREVVDPVFGQGPLQGLLTALENLQTEMAAVISVDMPFVDRAMIDFLLARIDMSFGVMTRGQPFPAVYRASAIDAVRMRLRSRKRSVLSLLDEPGFFIVDAPASWNASVWTNLNTPADLSALGLTGLRIK